MKFVLSVRTSATYRLALISCKIISLLLRFHGLVNLEAGSCSIHQCDKGGILKAFLNITFKDINYPRPVVVQGHKRMTVIATGWEFDSHWR